MTIHQIDKLLDTKLAKLENSIIKGLNPTVVTSDEIQKEKTIAIEKHCNAATSILHSPADVPSSPKILSSAASSFPVKLFKECTDLQLRQVHDLYYNNYNCQLHNFCLKTKNSEFRIDYLKCILT